LAAVALLISGCGAGHDRRDDRGLDPDFLAAVATAQALHYPVYWLGEEFTLDGLVFEGPDMVDFGSEREGGKVGMTYVAPIEGGNTALHLSAYSRNAWAVVEDRITDPQIPGEPRPVTRRTVTVATREAELLSLPLATREVNQLWLILDMGDGVVVAVAGSGGPVYPGGPDYNPFINNPDLLVQVIEDNLRPYPE
jgi:hypothetical protein